MRERKKCEFGWVDRKENVEGEAESLYCSKKLFSRFLYGKGAVIKLPYLLSLPVIWTISNPQFLKSLLQFSEPQVHTGPAQ